MSVLNFLHEKAFLQISDIIFRRSISSHLNFLSASQWWPEADLLEYQNERLQRLIRHAYENVPFYRDLFHSRKLTPKDIRQRNDLDKMPIVTKEMIRENMPRMVAQNLNQNELYRSSSSGSTGEPLKYFNTKDAYSMNIAANLRGWYWMGYRLGDKYVKLSQNPRKKREKKWQDFFTRDRYLPVQQLTDENFMQIVKEIQEYQPEFIRGYPDPLMFLSRYMRSNNITGIRPRAINSTGNILFPEVRTLIEAQFGCKVFDSYSCEGSATFFECPLHGCYHGAMEYAISEIIGKAGREVEPGQSGRHITTDLFSFAFPFIHYDTQDILVKSEQKCACGRQLPAVRQILGRDNDILVTPSGKFLIVHNFTGFFQQDFVNSVNQFQVVQDSRDRLIIKIVVDQTYTKKDEKTILDYWHEYIGPGMHIELQVVAGIPLSPSGKRRFIIRNQAISLGL